MKKITPELVKKWLAMPFPANRTVIAPFPCKTGKGYPTRIYVSIRRPTGKHFFYFGKPTPAALLQCRRALNGKLWSSFVMTEFDREGLLFRTTRFMFTRSDTNGAGGRQFCDVAAVYNSWQYDLPFFQRFANTTVQKSGTCKLGVYVTLEAAVRDRTPELVRHLEQRQWTIK